MAENDSVLAAAKTWKGEKMAIATVVSTWGSAPRPKGSHMLVHADGRFEGSVSGGCVESDILATAAEVIAGAPFQVRNYGVADAAAWEVGLPCGGEIAVMVQPVSAEGFDPELFDRIADARMTGWLAVLGGAPMFFYLLHLYVLRTLYLGALAIWGTNHGEVFGLSSIGWIWLMWLLLIVPLYLPTRWFSNLKKRRKDIRWLKYL